MNHGDRGHLINGNDVDDDHLSQDLETKRSNNDVRQRDNLSDNRGGDQPSEEPVKYTSQLASLLIIVNVTVGVGLLAMPSDMQTSGLATSLIVQMVFLALIVTSCIICTELTVKTGVNSLHRVVQAHCHPLVFQCTQVSILLLVFGTTVAFIFIIGDQSDRVFATLYGSTFCYQWYMNRRTIMSIVTVFVIKPLCCAKTVDFLKYGSFAGVASLGFIIYVVVSEFIKQDHIASDVNYLPKSWTDVGSILPVFCFAYQCQLSWVPTVATVRREEKYTSYKTITVAMVLTTIIYASVSILAVLNFGSAIQDDLTESYHDKGWTIITTIALVAFKCMVTLPSAFLPVRLSLIDILNKQFTRFANLSEPYKRYGVTLATLNIALLLALYVPDIKVAVDILGCLSVMFVFVLPGLCYLNLIRENRLMKQQLAGWDSAAPPVYTLKDKLKRTISYFFIIFGAVMTFMVLYKSIQNITSGKSSPPICHKP